MKSDFENEIWEAFLKDAVIEHSLKELEEYKADEIQQVSLPLHYVSVMKKFMHHYRHRTHLKSLMRSFRKIASVALISMGVSFSILLQFSEVRAACRNIITKVYERYIEFFYSPPGDSENSMPELGYIPTGYYIKEQYSINNAQYYILSNANDNEISLTCFNHKHTLHIDNEHYKIEPILIGDLEGEYFSSTDVSFESILVWNDEKRYYKLTSNLDKEILLKIAKNIK